VRRCARGAAPGHPETGTIAFRGEDALMAGALRPVVLLMTVAAALFVVDGSLDGVYPGGSAWLGSGEYHGLGWIAYAFAAINALMAWSIARGSERTLLGRIGLSAFFLLERPLTTFLLGPKPAPSIAVHFVTAFIELVILVGALRVWRLGRSVYGTAELDALFALDAPSPAPPPDAEEPPEESPRSSDGAAALLGTLALVLAAVLVADGLFAGFVPGGRAWGVVDDASGWLVYVFAFVVLMAAVRAVHGGAIPLRVLLALALIFFLERAFSPFALRVFDPVALGLHALAAFVSLALALATAGTIRSANGRAARFPTPQTT